MLLGVDVGGTFTDAVLLDGERTFTAKVPTTPRDQSAGVIAAVREVLSLADAEPAAIEHFAHGMTVGTNALLERAGARTLLVATEGFTDLLEIARQNRPSLYDLAADRPPPLSPPELRIGVRERIGPAGTVEPLADAEVERVVAAAERLGPEAIAICLLFSYVDPSHEERLAEALRKELPGVHVSASAAVLPRFREYERCSTTVVDAYLAPLLARYLGELTRRCAELELRPPVVMQSSGGVTTATEAADGGAWSVLSGPAGGAVGAGLIATLSGGGDALGFDMGGTSCDVCVVEGGVVRRTEAREFAGRPIQLPMVDVHTVGAGGGSIAHVDDGGALRVGPRSAGAEPGPACYGRGGREPTVTDANLLLGRLGAEGGLAGGVELDRDAAAAALAPVAERLGLELEEAAEGVLAVADAEMVRALRVVTVERGVDPRRFALLPFGGAGPLHACAIAAELGIERILCPRAGGVLSALGLVVSERRRETARSVMVPLAEATADDVAAEVEALAASLEPEEDAVVEAAYELRYRGQSFELDVPGTLRPEPDDLAEGFARAHEARYGYREEDGEIELVTIRVSARVPRAPLGSLSPGSGELARSRRRMRFGGEWLDGEVFTGEPAARFEAQGPCAFEMPETTLLLAPGWRARVDEHGTIVAEAGA
jgi:N-methylhydantoinase A